MADPVSPGDELSEEAVALCKWLSEFEWDFERAAKARSVTPRLLYRQWLESLGWNQSLAARLYRRKDSGQPVSRQAIEGQMKRFGVVRPPDLQRELAGQDLEGGLDALRDVHRFIEEQSSTERLCCEQLLELAETYKSLSLPGEARSAILAAADLAERTRSSDLISRAVRALPYNLAQVNALGNIDNAMVARLQSWVPLLRESGDAEALAYCLAYLGFEHHASLQVEDWESFRSLTQEAMEVAFQSGSSRAVNDISSIRIFALSDPEHLDERIGMLERMEDKLSDEGVDRNYWTLNLMVSDLLEGGRVSQAYSKLPRLRQLEDGSSAPWPARYRVSLAVLRGDWSEAEQLAQPVAQSPTPSAVQVRGLQQTEVLRHRGEWEDLATLARWSMNENPKNISARIRLASVLCLLGRSDETRPDFESWARDDFGLVPRDFTRINNLCTLAEICHALNDRENAAVLYRLLEPYRNRVNLIRVTAIVRGAVARYLGLLSHVREEWDRGSADFEIALELNEQLQARPYLAWTRCEFAALLVSAKREPVRARELARFAATGATSLGMLWLTERAEQLQARIS
jgi:thioredoxin-like negative regulator of GroEL